MRLVLVMRQVMGVMDSVMREGTREAGITAEDFLILAWLVERGALSGSDLGEWMRRARQSVQRSLVRLEQRGLVERLGSAVDGRTAAWALTDAGRRRFEVVEAWFHAKERYLRARDINVEKFAFALGELMHALLEQPRDRGWLGLVEPRPDTETPEWDL